MTTQPQANIADHSDVRQQADDAEFVRTETMYREPRLASMRFYSRGPNTAAEGESIYLFVAPPVDGLCRVLAVTVSDAVVAARNAAELRQMYAERDEAYANGGPWWIKPIGGSPVAS